MDGECVFYVVGGDKRSCYLSLYLAEKGGIVFHFDPFDADILRHSKVTIISGASGVGFKRLIQGECAAPGCQKLKILILPVPVTKDGEFVNGKTLLTVRSISDAGEEFDMVFGGVIPKNMYSISDGTPYVFDYMKDDVVATKNAVATAEGALVDAAVLSDINIDGSLCLVTGFGKCAKAIAGRLSAWGADVIVMARRPKQRKEAAMLGYKVMSFEDIDIYRDVLSEADFCFNTVPAMVVCEDLLSLLKGSAVVIDIANRQGGVDFGCCEELGIPYSHSLGIPGKISPKTSGIILAEATIKELENHK